MYSVSDSECDPGLITGPGLALNENDAEFKTYRYKPFITCNKGVFTNNDPGEL